MKNRIGNEVNHLGLTQLEADYSWHGYKSWIRSVFEAVLFVLLVGVIMSSFIVAVAIFNPTF